MLLIKKMLRDIVKHKMQFLTIFLMITLSVLVFSGIDSIRLGLKNNSERLYEETNIGNLWLISKGISEEKIEEIKDIDGVLRGERRLSKKVPINDNQQLELISSEENILSKPYVIEGEAYNNEGDGIWLNREFAEANNYAVGDFITIANQNVEIKGVILSSEKINESSAESFIIDYNNNGYGYVSPQMINNLFGFYMGNEGVLKVEEDIDTKSIIKKVESLLGENYLMSFDSKTQPSINRVADKVNQFTKFTYIFPTLFFALAILTMLTTMTRLVNNQRMQIGTLMSLGYSPSKIRSHYLSYGFWLGLFGGALGIVLGYFIIPPVVTPILSNIFML